MFLTQDRSLGYNRIGVIEGLESLYSLEELDIDHQHLDDGESLIVDPRSIAAIAESLVRLNASGNVLADLSVLAPLTALQRVALAESGLDDLSAIVETLGAWPALESADLRGNAACLTPAARNLLIVRCGNLSA